MKLLPAFLLPLTAVAGETPLPPRSMHTFVDNNHEFTLQFETSPERRYIVGVGPDPGNLAEHYLSPFKDTGAGLKVRQIGEYAPSREFYRVAVLPWKFQNLDATGDWIWDLSMSRLPDGRTAFVYQNRRLNALYFGEAPADGSEPLVRQVAGTGVVDEPGLYDNSYSNVTLQISPGGIPWVVCMDNHSDELILLGQPAGAGRWERIVIRSGFAAPYWVFPSFAISPQGTFGIVYRGDDGSYFADAQATSPQVWNHVRISPQSPSSADETGIVFDDAGDAIAQAGGWFRVDRTTRAAVPVWMTGQVQSRRGSDGSLLSIVRSFDGSRIYRSTDGGASWADTYVARQAQDGIPTSVDCDAVGRLSVFRPPALYRQITPGGSWQRTVMRGHAIHLAGPLEKIQMILVEYDREVSLVTED